MVVALPYSPARTFGRSSLLCSHCHPPRTGAPLQSEARWPLRRPCSWLPSSRVSSCSEEVGDVGKRARGRGTGRDTVGTCMWFGPLLFFSFPFLANGQRVQQHQGRTYMVGSIHVSTEPDPWVEGSMGSRGAGERWVDSPGAGKTTAPGEDNCTKVVAATLVVAVSSHTHGATIPIPALPQPPTIPPTMRTYCIKRYLGGEGCGGVQ